MKTKSKETPPTPGAIAQARADAQAAKKNAKAAKAAVKAAKKALKHLEKAAKKARKDARRARKLLAGLEARAPKPPRARAPKVEGEPMPIVPALEESPEH
jgi:chromosome segregation ATPase